MVRVLLMFTKCTPVHVTVVRECFAEIPQEPDCVDHFLHGFPFSSPSPYANSATLDSLRRALHRDTDF
jgi:hypothetical protein